MQFINSKAVSLLMLFTLYQSVLAAHFLPRQIDTSLLPALTTAIESVLSSASSSASTSATSGAAAATGSGVPGLPRIPECSQKCFTTAIQGDGCEITDIGCHCSKEGQLRDTINPCLVSNCAPQDRADFDHAIAVVCQNVTTASSATTTAFNASAANTTSPGQYVGYVSSATSAGNKTNLIVIATAVSNSSSTDSSSPTSGSANTTTDMGSSSTETSTATRSPSETGVMSSTSEALGAIHVHGGVLLDIMLFLLGWAAVF
ncbi:MAG: hypothetical protein M1835_007189 [Candelina submexicana]|nr:MAG: hypothetical protein M1835_007189 [Candelina submexicana]